MVLGVSLGVFSCSCSQRVARAGISRRLAHPVCGARAGKSQAAGPPQLYPFCFTPLPQPPLLLSVVPPALQPQGQLDFLPGGSGPESQRHERDCRGCMVLI